MACMDAQPQQTTSLVHSITGHIARLFNIKLFEPTAQYKTLRTKP
jgi:hypothetical protein